MACSDVPLTPGDAVRIRGERWLVVQQCRHGDVSTLDVRGADRLNGGHTARFLLPFEPLHRDALPTSPRVVRPAAWQMLARALLARATPRIDSLRVAQAAHIDVFAYQLEPALAVTRGHCRRLLIADDVGLGKTIQAGLIVAEQLHRIGDARALIICPAGLRRQWQHELHSRFGLTAAVIDGSGVSQAPSALDQSANPWITTRLAITSIDFVKRPEVMRAVEGLIWDVLVFDEAHNLSGHTDRSSAAAALARRARTVVMLSATPHSGDDRSFARLCALGDCSGRFPLTVFRRSRADVGIGVDRKTRWMHVRPTDAETAMHAALLDYARQVWRQPRANDGARLAMSVLLRRAASSATSLARSIDRRLAALAEYSEPQPQLVLPFATAERDDEPTAVLATPGLDDRAEERRHLARVLTLARLASTRESKVAALLRWFRRVDRPVLIFTEYRDTLTHLRAAFIRSGIPSDRIAELHGGLSRRDREEAARRFTAGPADVLLATDAASEGLNLHHRCRCVISLEVPWSPIRMEQRVGRVDRIGQRRAVHAIHFVAAQTTEVEAMQRVCDRAARAGHMLDTLEPSDIDIANAILTGVELSPLGPQRSASTAMIKPRTSEIAETEAAWILTTRRLTPALHVRIDRPFTTACAGGRGRHAIAVFEIAFMDVDGVVVWSTLVGCGTVGIAPGRTRHGVRAALSLMREVIDQPLARASIDLLAADAAILKATVTLDSERERAIAAAIRLRHARIAADMLQPGLFDRRAERRAAAQARVLEEALGRCHARLDALKRLDKARIASPAFRFALFR